MDEMDTIKGALYMSSGLLAGVFYYGTFTVVPYIL